jgi:hypothetical protein
MKIQKQKSSKLFYKKYPFKIECLCAGAHKLSSYYYKNSGDLLFNKTDKPEDRKKIKEFSEKTKFLSSMSDLRIRTEGVHFNIFCMNFEQVEHIEKELSPWISAIRGPTSKEELEFLLENGPKKILCDRLPRKIFKYRIYFKNKFPLDKRQQFFQWVEKNNDKVSLSYTSKRWMRGERSWAQDPFGYVKDDKSLSMIGLQLSGFVKSIDEFVERNQALVT